MLWTVFVVLLLLWILGFSFHVAGSLIHLLLVIAVVVLIIQLITGRRVVLHSISEFFGRFGLGRRRSRVGHLHRSPCELMP